MDSPLTLTVLVSGGGTTLQNLIDLIARRELRARIDRVIGSRDDLGAADRAAHAALPYSVIRRADHAGVEGVSRAIFSLAAGSDLVVCAGWLQLLTLPPAWVNRVINVHPALLPAFGGPGMYGRHVHQAVLNRGCKVSGCTVHFVDDQYDHGPIILQRCCPVYDDDTPATLAARVQALERLVLPQAIRLIAEGRLVIEGRSVKRRSP